MTTPRWHQPLLPGELRENPDGRRSARDWIVDVLMYVIAVGVGAGVLADSWEEHGETMVFVDIGLGIACLIAIWWRRSHPALVGVLTTAAGIVSGLAAGSALIAGFNVALRGSFRAILAVLGVTACSIFIFPLVYASGEPYLLDLFIGALITAVVLGWGLFARARREQVLSLHERAAQLEAEQRLRVDQAREAERRRIAREMHDVLAHRVSLLSLHAGALEVHPDAPVEEITRAAGVVRASAHQALEDLRQVIDVLRAAEPTTGEAERPQPTLRDVAALVDETRDAGTAVELAQLIDAESLPAALGRTVYRIVQEGLTNARKHAPLAAVETTVSGAPGSGVVVEVVSRPPLAQLGREAIPGAGAGLIGLAERIQLAGGRLEHGHTETGDYRLWAWLPWHE